MSVTPRPPKRAPGAQGLWDHRLWVRGLEAILGGMLAIAIALAEDPSVPSRQAFVDAPLAASLAQGLEGASASDAAAVADLTQWARRPFDRLFVFRPRPPAGRSRPSSERPPSPSPTREKLLAEHAERLWRYAERLRDTPAWPRCIPLAFEALAADPTLGPPRRFLGPEANAIFEPPRAARMAGPFAPPRSFSAPFRLFASPHFRVSTSAPPAAAYALLRELESVHLAWHQVFVPLWTTQEAVRDAWAKGGIWKHPRVHDVVLFRSRQEYLRFLRPLEPHADRTQGMYRAKDRRAYFFVGQRDPSTWRHEATHQLFHEVLSAAENVGDERNFWAIEAVALYFESLQPGNEASTLGGLEADRLQLARYRGLHGKRYVPLPELSRFGREALQGNPELPAIYSQLAGLGHFFMHFEQGRYEGAWIEFLRDVYQGRDTVETLEKRTGRSLTELDEEYHTAFLPVTDAMLASSPPLRPRSLSLASCPITDTGLVACEAWEWTDIHWLDLSGCDIADAAVPWLQRAVSLRQLSLENTRISDVTVALCAKAKNLEELDLSGTRVTDAGIAALRDLPRLHTLYLTATAISDACLKDLLSLPQLRVLDISQTQITPDGHDRLRRARPRLELLGPTDTVKQEP